MDQVSSLGERIQYVLMVRDDRTLRDYVSQSESDVLYCNVFGVSIVILDSVEAVNDLLDKRSAIYSSRCG